MNPDSTSQSIDSFDPRGNWPGAFALVGSAWRAVRNNPSFTYLFVGLLSIFAVLNYVVNPTDFFDFNFNNNPPLTPQAITLTIAIVFVNLILSASLTLYQLYLTADKAVPPAKTILLSGLRRAIPFVTLNLIMIAMIIVGFMLFIIPGVILILRLVVANYVFFDKKLSPTQAIKASFALTSGRTRLVIDYFGLVILFSLAAGILSTGLPIIGEMASYFITVIYGVVGAWLYRWLNANHNIDEEADMNKHLSALGTS